MGSALVYVVVVGVVAGAVYLVAALVFGRGEELAPMPPGATPTRLPARDLTGGDVRDLRFQQTVRGYKCSEVDWALDRLAAEVDALRARLDVVTAARPGDPAQGDVDADEPTGPTDAGPVDAHRDGGRVAARAVPASVVHGRDPVPPPAASPRRESGSPSWGMEPGDPGGRPHR